MKIKKSKSAKKVVKYISIKNAKTHNLKNINVDVPRNRFTVISGVSGSGKSSLAFDTLYAEGQRRFVESLSAYARQFLERMSKPDVESISGLPPAIAIGQNSPPRNPRSTVGTSTEIYDHLRLLLARIGVAICYKCGAVVRKDTAQSSVETILKYDDGDRIYILFSPNPTKQINEELDRAKQLGYFRTIDIATGEISELDDALPSKSEFEKSTYFLADRLILSHDDELITRLTDSVEAALSAADGKFIVWNQSKNAVKKFSTIFECADCDIRYEEPEPRLFSFNNPKGACPHCQGFGRTMGIDEDAVVPDKSLSISNDAILPFKSTSFFKYKNDLLKAMARNNITPTIPYKQHSEEELKIIWDGDGKFGGINGFFKMLEENSYKMHYRVMLSRFRGFTKCKHCNGSRLRMSARQVFIAGKNMPELVQMPLGELYDFFKNLQLNEYDFKVAEQLLKEITSRLEMLVDIGLHYLNLSRLSHTLSGGESQRINLATALGSALVGTLYVLDEPSVGMHPRDTDRLLKILFKLRNLGNTIVVVEHDPDIIKYADYIIDMGPYAGHLGGEVVYQGEFSGLENCSRSLTADYFAGRKKIEIPKSRRKAGSGEIRIYDVQHNNLNIKEVAFPLHSLVVVTGVSGSGKSSLVHNVLYAGLKKMSGSTSMETGYYSKITGAERIRFVELVDQSSVSGSIRSTPATYTKVFDFIREAFASTQAAKQLGLRPGYFSFNVSGGRCEVCEGEGYVNVDMQFLPDVRLVCEVCGGTRYKKEARNVLYNGKSIVDVLDMTVDEAADFFADNNRITNKLAILQSVGLGYIKLGQPSSMLSGGESQRVKLASHLDSHLSGETLFIFDEPTSGLHLDDISKLLSAIQALVKKGHSAVIIEHNLHIIAAADWIIDLGPEAGDAGGRIVAEGTPEKIMKVKDSHTAEALRNFLGETDV